METLTAGFHRVHLASLQDDDAITLYLPLTAEGHLDAAAPRPHLCTGRWNGQHFYGEFLPGGVNARTHHLHRIATADLQILTDLLTAPLEPGTQITMYVGDSTEGEAWPFVVRDLRHV